MSPLHNVGAASSPSPRRLADEAYTVRPGDTLSEIAARHGVSLQALLAANPQIRNPDLIFAGEQLNIPPGGSSSYRVQSGDTLWDIAREHGTTVDALVRANGIADPDLIHVGDLLRLPGSGGSTPAQPNRPSSPSSPPSPSSPGAARVTPGELPDTAGLSQSQKYALYAGYVNRFGSAAAKDDLAAGRRVVLTLRVDTSTRANAGNGVYDDRMVMLWTDAAGTRHVREFRANADPSGQYEPGGPYTRRPIGSDYGGDARGDPGRLADGTYRFTRGTYRGREAMLAGSDQVTERDVNHDGRFDDGVRTARGGYGMHIHMGGEGNTGSAGCLTLPPAEHARFFAALGGQASLNNVVVNTSRLPASSPNAPATPGAPAAPARPGSGRDDDGHRLGQLSERYETGGRGPGTVSGGVGDIGGVSYGTYQLASNLGRPEQFLASEGRPWRDEFAGLHSGSAAFTAKWKQIAAREPERFEAAQHAYIERTHYREQIDHVKARTGVDLSRHSAALRDVVWSTAVQHGPASEVIVRAMARLAGRVSPGEAGYDRALINAIYDERGKRDANGELAYFSGNSRAVQESVAQRFVDERRDALALLARQDP